MGKSNPEQFIDNKGGFVEWRRTAGYTQTHTHSPTHLARGAAHLTHCFLLLGAKQTSFHWVFGYLPSPHASVRERSRTSREKDNVIIPRGGIVVVVGGRRSQIPVSVGHTPPHLQ